MGSNLLPPVLSQQHLPGWERGRVAVGTTGGNLHCQIQTSVLCLTLASVLAKLPVQRQGHSLPALSPYHKGRGMTVSFFQGASSS